jgi:hypothetical protein
MRSVVQSRADYYGVDGRRAMADAIGQSNRVLTLLAGDEVVAVYGRIGSMLAGEVTIWIAASPEIVHHRKAFVKACHDEFRNLIATNARLVGYVAADDVAAIGFVCHFGFRVGEPMANGMCKAVL